MVEPAIEPYHQRGAGRLDDIEALADALGVEVDRLLAEDRLFGPRGALDQIGVRVGRRADRDCVDFGGGENLLDRPHPGAGRLREAGRGARIRVGDERDSAILARGDVACVNLADAPRADDAEFHAFLPRASRAPIDICVAMSDLQKRIHIPY